MPQRPNPAKRGTYNPADIESRWYAFWEERDLFRTDAHSDKEPHVIVMPPPNVTGRLHMGHALQDTVQDALTRIRRMQGMEALWVPGMDHAGIATQNVVEKALKKEEGKNRHDLGRDAFLKKVWDWVDEYGGIILDQKRRLGDSCDWSKERFTMDDGFSRAVQEVFVRLYNEGLIYRGEYLINWCPVDMTALSDEEVDNVERNGHLWYVRYDLVDAEGSVTVATTRPETMLGDTAIAVHPEDERYAGLVGKRVRLPLTNRTIPIIADEYVKSDFGAGALKITPGHDKNDFEIGQRHGLEVIGVIGPDGRMNELAGAYEGMDRFDARERMVEDLEAAGVLERVEDYRATVPVSSRSKAIIEPLISRQWFVRMEPLAKPALEAVRDGRIRFHPKRWENEYFRWLENIRDWTISRQLWWGHRIPVWYHVDADGEVDESRDFVVSIEQPEPGMVQDQDVLDTWFSSWLWPFATLGWPDKTDDLAKFHPGSVLVSGYDILFFWIARMIMAGMHFTGEVPFRDIFITGMIKDKQGRWMSKSLGNGIDPLDMIEQYGADAVRFSLTVLCAQGQDIKLDPTKFEMGRNFATKIWNAFNVFGQFMEPGVSYERKRSFDKLDLVERWMLTRLAETIEGVEADLERYRLNEAAMRVYSLFWSDYCDWYLELIKPVYGNVMEEDRIALALEVYETMLQLLHPFMPFITEELWVHVRPRGEGDVCMTSTWPAASMEERDAEGAAHFSTMQELISGIRNIRAQYNVPPSQEITATLSVEEGLVAPIAEHRNYFERLARVGTLDVGVGRERPKASASVVVGRNQVFVPLAGMIDLDVERERLEKEISSKEGFLKGVEKKLLNEQFVARAPDDVVARERAKASDARAEISRLKTSLAELE
ncbi:MAG: valine--tRNA ligase [Bacteroidetes bacterium CG12_big_fil_rev_8_21_14_0_65_60_17]|nr:MAG: valine--tRNA ligase [Bacteroidetes bacterium CG12_big_fil_rev_8_21_14_0_65_60_17]